jgi:hypothetical protein
MSIADSAKEYLSGLFDKAIQGLRMREDKGNSQNETEFLLHLYDALWENMRSKENRLWTFLSIYGAAVGLVFAGGQASRIPGADLFALIIVMALTVWAVLIILNANWWYARNQLMVTRIEGRLPKAVKGVVPKPYYENPNYRFDRLYQSSILVLGILLFLLYSRAIWSYHSTASFETVQSFVSALLLYLLLVSSALYCLNHHEATIRFYYLAKKDLLSDVRQFISQLKLRLFNEENDVRRDLSARPYVLILLILVAVVFDFVLYRNGVNAGRLYTLIIVQSLCLLVFFLQWLLHRVPYTGKEWKATQDLLIYDEGMRLLDHTRERMRGDQKPSDPILAAKTEVERLIQATREKLNIDGCRAEEIRKNLEDIKTIIVSNSVLTTSPDLADTISQWLEDFKASSKIRERITREAGERARKLWRLAQFTREKLANLRHANRKLGKANEDYRRLEQTKETIHGLKSCSDPTARQNRIAEIESDLAKVQGFFEKVVDRKNSGERLDSITKKRAGITEGLEKVRIQTGAKIDTEGVESLESVERDLSTLQQMITEIKVERLEKTLRTNQYGVWMAWAILLLLSASVPASYFWLKHEEIQKDWRGEKTLSVKELESKIDKTREDFNSIQNSYEKLGQSSDELQQKQLDERFNRFLEKEEAQKSYVTKQEFERRVPPKAEPAPGGKANP